MTTKKEKNTGQNKSNHGKSNRTSGAQRVMNIVLGIIMITGIVSTALGGRMLARQKSAQQNPIPTKDLSRVVLNWQREGGIAGECDELFVTLGGKASADNCSADKKVSIGTQELSQDQLQQLQGWVGRYQSFTVRPSGTPVPDGFDLKLIFQGSGNREIDEAGLQEIEHLAEEIFGGLANEPSPDNANLGS